MVERLVVESSPANCSRALDVHIRDSRSSRPYTRLPSCSRAVAKLVAASAHAPPSWITTARRRISGVVATLARGSEAARPCGAHPRGRRGHRVALVRGALSAPDPDPAAPRSPRRCARRPRRGARRRARRGPPTTTTTAPRLRRAFRAIAVRRGLRCASNAAFSSVSPSPLYVRAPYAPGGDARRPTNRRLPLGASVARPQ